MNALHEVIHRPRPSIWAQFRQAPVVFLARKLYVLSQSLTNDLYAQQSQSRPHPHAISVVCISDTHNTQPALPDGDILIHAGDLTASGTFEEIQDTLKWLKSQPHRHKIVIAGNHDLLLDRSLDQVQWVESRGPSGSRKRKIGVQRGDLRESLDWGDVIYLQNTSTTVTVDFPTDTKPESTHASTTSAEAESVCPRHRTSNTNSQADDQQNATRTIKIFGSPLSPKNGNWAFQYPRDENVWFDEAGCIIPPDTDILMTHCPPRTHLDAGNLGCAHLLQALWGMQKKPALHVFGHIHSGYGIEKVGWDRVQKAYEDCALAEKSCELKGIWNLLRLGTAVLMQMVFWAVGFLLGRVMLPAAFSRGKKGKEMSCLGKVESKDNKGTLMVNAAAVGGLRDDERRSPIKVWL